MSNQSINGFVRENKTILIIMVIGLFLVELEIFALAIMKSGRIYALCEDGCVPGDDVFFRHTTGTGTEIGALRTDADTATADQITGATWETTTAAGEIGIIQLPW